jgi:hypothetical protein
VLFFLKYRKWYVKANFIIKSIIQAYCITTFQVGGIDVKVYLQENSVTVVGKPWQVKHILRKYMEEFDTVQEWVDSQKQTKRPTLKRIK